MSRSNFKRDYYEVIGADHHSSTRDLDRLYKRMAARLHPDKGGDEEEMKLLNEAYQVLKDPNSRKHYDAQRQRPVTSEPVASAPAAKDVGLLGHGLSAFFCLLMGVFLLILVRSQWIWFLWPLGILSLFVIGFGIVMARGAMRAVSSTLSDSNPVRRHTGVQEVAFWTVVVGGGYGIYLLITNF